MNYSIDTEKNKIKKAPIGCLKSVIKVFLRDPYLGIFQKLFHFLHSLGKQNPILKPCGNQR
jgi:hypothetical protein